MGEFDSAWRKWYWAGLHAKAYEANLERFATQTESPPVLTIRAEYHPKRHAFAVIVDSITPLPVWVGLQLGDVANNYRSALDHLAWALAQRGTAWASLTDGKKNRIYFPICGTAEQFRKDHPIKLPGVRRADLTVVRRYQPYRLGKRKGRLHTFTILTRLNNRDKHQQIQPVQILPTRVLAYKISDVRDCEITRQPKHGTAKPLDVDTELWLIGVRRTGSNPELKMQVDLTAQVGVEEGTTVIEWLDQTRWFIASLLRRFSEPPADVDLSP